jgi:hypothetical protein
MSVPKPWVQFRLEERMPDGTWVEPANAWGQNYTGQTEGKVQAELEVFVLRGWKREDLRIRRYES